MQNKHSINEQEISVVPYDHAAYAAIPPIKINLLRFWHNDSFLHQVNERNVYIFLLHVQLFGATICPDYPQLGCSAINGDMPKSKEVAAVGQIYYKGEIIWCRC